jgi:hypothetical protein
MLNERDGCNFCLLCVVPESWMWECLGIVMQDSHCYDSFCLVLVHSRVSLTPKGFRKHGLISNLCSEPCSPLGYIHLVLMDN